MEPLKQTELKELLEELCLPSKSLESKLSNQMKAIYKASVNTAGKKKFGAFESLIVDNLDCDSIWEEIRSRCEPLSKYLADKSNKLENKLLQEDSFGETSDAEDYEFENGDENQESENESNSIVMEDDSEIEDNDTDSMATPEGHYKDQDLNLIEGVKDEKMQIEFFKTIFLYF